MTNNNNSLRMYKHIDDLFDNTPLYDKYFGVYIAIIFLAYLYIYPTN